MDSTGGTIWTYRVLFDADVVKVDAFSPATEDISASVRADSITEIGFSGISAGVYDLGQVLPAGLSEAEFSSLVGEASFIGEPGTGVKGLDFDINGVRMALAVVPEPRLEYLFALSFVFVALIRRRDVSSSSRWDWDRYNQA